MPGPQLELRAEVSPELADTLEAHFYESQSTDWGVMQRGRGDPYELFGIFPDEATATAALLELRKSIPTLPENFQRNRIKDADWQNAYKAYVTAWSDRQLHWVPLWERDTAPMPEGGSVVYLDAGMAFGTGSHETTRLCARRLLDYLETNPDRKESAEIIDAGCGSGVLAFSAAALGFRRLRAFDFDPEAIEVCRGLARENAHLPPVQFAVADLEMGLGRRSADLLLANIQTDILIPHADTVVQGVKPGGTLVLSGILAVELAAVRTHYAQRFGTLRPGESLAVDSRQDGEWSDLRIELHPGA